MVKVSVIVPVYNVENYLNRCLDSIIQQTLTDIEIICIDDGSTDAFLTILKEYAKKDNRIKIISKKNEGLSVARNIGIECANGEYISFVDSDDYISLDTLEKTYKSAVNNNSDVVMFKIATFNEEDNFNYSYKKYFKIDEDMQDVNFENYVFTFHEIRKHIMNTAFAAWAKIYKRSFLSQYDDFKFPEGLIFEDIPFHIKAILRAERISFVPEFLYKYRLSNPNSIMKSNLNREDIFEICDLVEKYLKDENYFDEFKKEFYEFKISQITYYLNQANSEAYFNSLKLELENINPDFIPENLIDKVNLILNSNNLNEFNDYNEYNLGNNCSVRQDREFNVVFKNGKPTNILKRSNNKVYNKIFDFKPEAINIAMKKDKISMDFIVNTKKFKNHDLSAFTVNIENNYYNFSKSSDNIYNVDIPYNSMKIDNKTAGIFLFFKDENGFSFKRKFLSIKSSKNKNNELETYASKIQRYDNCNIYIYETGQGFLSIVSRKKNVTDSFIEQKKIKLAFLKQKLDVKLGKNEPSILIYEKFCGKYEESGKYVYQELIDKGCENVYFVLDKNTDYYREIPKKYRKNIINKHSFKHYYEYFNAKTFISTETLFNAVELTNYNSLIRNRLNINDYFYFFLQHGVMYGYSLKGRTNFIKGAGFKDNSFVVISSEKEAEHFTGPGKFDREDLIKTGLPKFDHAIKNKNANKIFIMPTSRNFEYSNILNNTENSTYYKFAKRIINCVPNELKDKIIFAPHPIVKDILLSTDLNKFIPSEVSYDKLLRDTRLLITDYSSISFDAFYRGCNVLFAWMDKEMCLKNLDFSLMLNEENIFGDIAYDYETLDKLILKNYYDSPTEEHIEKYRKIVEFNDKNNTNRFLEYLFNTNVFPEKAEKVNVENLNIKGIIDQPYTGKKIIPNIKVSHDGKKLVENLDFKIKLKNNKKIGTATVKIIGKGIYCGTKSINFEIKRNIKKCKFQVEQNKIVSIRDKNKELIENKDYFYKIVKYHGVYIDKLFVKGMGEYSGQKRFLFDVKNKNRN